MQKQISYIENQLVYEINKVEEENRALRNELEAIMNNKRDIKISFRLNNEPENNYELTPEFFMKLNSNKDELLRTRESCNSILKLDNKKLENIKSRFVNIKEHIELRNNKYYIDEHDAIDSNEHLEVLR